MEVRASPHPLSHLLSLTEGAAACDTSPGAPAVNDKGRHPPSSNKGLWAAVCAAVVAMQGDATGEGLPLPLGAAVLVQVPQAELRQVAGGVQTLLAEGPFAVNSVKGAGETQIRAQVGATSWEVRPASQTLRAGELTYVFSTPEAGVFYALTLGAGTEPEALGVVEAVLEGVSLLRESERLLGDEAAQRGEAALAEGVAYRYGLARGIHAASSSIASGLMVSATYASSAFERASGYLKTGQPTERPVQLSEGFKRRVDKTASVAQWLSRAAGSVVGGLAWLGGKVADGMLWAVGADKPLKPGQDAGLLREVSHASLSSFTGVWDSMEAAGLLVLTSARDSTAGVVHHRYGAEAGAASAKGMNAAGYAGDAFWSATRIGPRTVAKAAAKRTAKGVIRKWTGQEAPDAAGAGGGAGAAGVGAGPGQAAAPGAGRAEA